MVFFGGVRLRHDTRGVYAGSDPWCRYMSVYVGIVIVQINKYMKIHAETYEYIQYLHIVI